MLSRFIYNHKYRLMIVSAIFIAYAFFNHYVVHTLYVSEILLIVSSILGLLPILLQAISALKVKVISIDVLVVLAVSGAFMIKNYEESAIVTFLFLLGSFLEQKTLNHTKKAIKQLTDLTPLEAEVIRENGVRTIVPIDEVNIGDSVVVKTGSKVPVDGIIIEGSGYLNEASINGEPLPTSKSVSDSVYATSIVEDGYIVVKTTAIEEDTTFGKIVEMVIEAQDKKSRAWRFMDRFSTYYTPAVLLFGIVMGIIFWDLALGVTILVLGCPGALVIGIPVSNVAGIGFAAKQGILFKGSETISDLAKSDVFIFDKTGTLTKGTPEVVEMIHFVEHPYIHSYYRSLEQSQTHPLAKAIVQYVNDAPLMEITNLEVIKGKGLRAIINNNHVLLGNIALISDNHIDVAPAKEAIKRFEEKGLSYVILSENNVVLSIVSIGDQLRDYVKEDLNRLKKLGVKETYILSGDNQAAVDGIIHKLKMTKGYGHMLPEDKKAFVDELISSGKKVTFVGDGINDAPSLASATIGITMKGGTDVAIETSDVVLMQHDFLRLVTAKRLAQKIRWNIWENLAIAIAVVLTLLYLVIFEEGMTMSIGMLVHEFSILVVILNGMRLLKTKIKENRYEKTNLRT